MGAGERNLAPSERWRFLRRLRVSPHLRGQSVGSNLNRRGRLMLSPVWECKIKGGVGLFDTLTFFKGFLVASLTSDVAK